MDKYNASRKVGCCPNPAHDDHNPSCSYNPKNHSFHCWSCGADFDLLTAYMMHDGCSFLEACERLFQEAGMEYDFTERGVRQSVHYKYPKPEYAPNKNKVYAYWKTRCISPETIDYLDIQEDLQGNTLFQYRDLNDVLVTVKLRKSAQVKKGERKCWHLPGADTSNYLYNINKISTTQPLIITSGEGDCATAIECGFYNTVSINGGDQNTQWISECWDFLQQFEDIYLIHDNDESGKKFAKEVTSRLGEYRVKIVSIPTPHTLEDGSRVRVKDLNELLYYQGKEAVREAINSAAEAEIPTVIDYTDVSKFDMSDVPGFVTGLHDLDAALDKMYMGTTTILTGVAGCVDADTEFFDGTQWKRIADYVSGDKVLQYHMDGHADLCDPEKYHVYPCDEFWHLKSRGVEQMVSDEHNIVYVTSKGHIQKKSALEVVNQYNSCESGFYGKFITTFKYGGEGLSLTDEELRVMCAVVCDGHFPNKINKRCRVNIKKMRKQDRMRKLLEAANIPYEVHKYNPQDLEYDTFYFEAPMKTKVFTEEWYNCSQHQIDIIAQEILFWDGSMKNSTRMQYHTTVKENADFIQFVFSAHGWRSRLSVQDRRGQARGKYIRKSIEYTVSATSQNMVQMKNRRASGPEHITRVPSPDGKKYCFTVPTGMLVLRRDGIINITGNSGKSSLLSTIICKSIDQGFPAFVYSGELSNQSLKSWIDSSFAGQRGMNAYESPVTGNTYYKVKPEVFKKINQTYKGKLFFYRDGFDHKVSRLLQTAENIVRRHGVKTLIFDNMTSVDLEADDRTKYQHQETFIRDVIEFSKRWQVCCVVVLHPKKMEALRRMTLFDLQGVTAAPNLAHRVLSLYRVSKKEKEGEMNRNGTDWYRKPIPYDVIIDVLKDRFGSAAGKEIGLYYDIPSRRFFDSIASLDYRYAWDDSEPDGTWLPFGVPQFEEANEVFGEVRQ